MKPHRNGHDTGVDLDVLALRYVTGELAPGEIETFEARIAEDQEARESVSRAVAIGMAVAAQPGLEASVSGGQFGVAQSGVAQSGVAQSGGTQPGGAQSVGTGPRWFRWPRLAAAVLVIGAGLVVYLNRDVAAPESLPTDQDLIASWVDFHDLQDSGDLLAEHEMFGNASGSIELESSMEFGAETPSWMVLVLAK